MPSGWFRATAGRSRAAAGTTARSSHKGEGGASGAAHPCRASCAGTGSATVTVGLGSEATGAVGWTSDGAGEGAAGADLGAVIAGASDAGEGTRGFTARGTTGGAAGSARP